MKRSLLLILVLAFAVLLTAFPASAEFTLQLASFRDQHDAQRYLDRLQLENQKAFVHTQESPPDQGGVWHKVRVGPFVTRTAALDFKSRMLDQGHQGDILVVQARSGETLEPTASPSSELPLLVENDQHNPKPKGISQEERSSEERTVTLNWEPSTEPDIGGYRIHYDTQPGPPYEPAEEDWVEEGPSPISVDKDITQITLHGLSVGKSYHFSITAYDETSGMESGYSQEVIAQPASLENEASEAEEPARETEEPPGAEESREEHSSRPPPGDGLVPDIPLSELTQEEPSGPQRGAVASEPAPSPIEEPEADSQPQVETASEQADGLTRVQAGDVLDIEVPGQKDMSQRYDVDPNGDLFFIMLGRISVGGLTLGEFEEKLETRLSRYLMKGDRVKVLLMERKRYIQIAGGVRYPGWYRVPYLASVRELVELAGGPLEHADSTQVLLRRKTADDDKEREVHGQIQLQPNDELFVPYPEVYQVRVDRGDVLFVSIPQRQPPSRRPDARDSADLREAVSRNQVTVDRKGYLYVADYGHFYVNGLTTEEIKKIITDRLPKYLANLQAVSVSMIEKSHYIDVSGHVSNPGRYNLPEAADAQEALNKAGGAVDGAVMSDVYIIRKQEGQTRRIQVNMYQYSITGDPRLLTPLHEEDTLFVPISPAFGNIKRTLRSWEPPPERLEEETEKKVRIFGAVQNPGIYEPKEDMDLLDLLVLASGERDDADLSKIAIIRNNKVEVLYNLHQFLEGRGEGPSLKMPKIQHGDTVYVRYVETKVMEPKEDKVWYITGKVQSPGQYKLWDQMTVLQAIARAGGLQEWADAEHITIVRMVDGKQENLPYNYHKGVAGKYPELNIYLQADDTIVVP